ncbi:hypothetical protein Tco_1177208 [Tanacetum coccineum]
MLEVVPYPDTTSYRVVSTGAFIESSHLRGLLIQGSDPDAEYALSRLLQRGTVAEYQNEFEMLISRVTGKSNSLLTTIYISGLKPALQRVLLWSNPTTLGGSQNKAFDSPTTPEVAHEVAPEIPSKALRETTTTADTVAKIEETSERRTWN